MRIALNNGLSSIIRIMPAIDAFASTKPHDFVIKTPYAELFAGKPYDVTSEDIDVDVALPSYKHFIDAYENPCRQAYIDLRHLAGADDQYYPAPADLPKLNVLWDRDKLMCHDGKFVRNTIVCSCQKYYGSQYSVSKIRNVLFPLAKRMSVVNVVGGPEAPMIPMALEVSNKVVRKMGSDSNPGSYSYHDLLDLGRVVRAFTVGGVIVTNTQWGYDLAVALRIKAALLQDDAVEWKNPYDERKVPPYRIFKASLGDDETRAGILELLNAAD